MLLAARGCKLRAHRPNPVLAHPELRRDAVPQVQSEHEADHLGLELRLDEASLGGHVLPEVRRHWPELPRQHLGLQPAGSCCLVVVLWLLAAPVHDVELTPLLQICERRQGR